MNFVDVQPKSFLDYAWTSPSPAPQSAAKSSKTSRKQNRCCDQCRKGKRACDAAILEDTLLDNTGASGGNPTVFHYSDVFGPLAACSNCEKTKKQCTFEWLRSQRVSQATPQASTAPPAKKRRKSSSSSSPQGRIDAARQSKVSAAPQVTTASDPPTASGAEPVPRNELSNFAVTFADFPGIPAFEICASSSLSFDPRTTADEETNDMQSNGYGYLSNVLEEEDEALFENDSGKGSSLETSSEGRYASSQDDSPICSNGHKAADNQPQVDVVAMPVTRKRRRRSPSHTPCAWRAPHPSLSPTNNLLSSTNANILTDGLLKIYHDSFENALSCWLTERTCPYSKDSDVSLANDIGPDWNRIYHRVFRLDRLAGPIRGRNLTFGENKAASRALNLAIFSFATQWAQSGERSNAKYPFHSDRSDERSGVFVGNTEASFAYKDFDRTLQVSAWHEARMALQSASEIESFRVVLAQIVFSLAQKPTDPNESPSSGEHDGSNNVTFSVSDLSPMSIDEEPTNADMSRVEDNDVNDCEDLLSRLSLTMDSDGPPVHLEQGLRLIHSLRSRVAMSGVLNKPTTRRARNSNGPTNRLEAGDQATVDLLFWLGVMFDTLSSAMHKRPLVVSDEDSDIYANEPRPATSPDDEKPSSLHRADSTSSASSESEGLWDDYLFARQSKWVNHNLVRWPCSYDQASSLLCDAAPVKVLLYRKVTRIQTLLARNIRGERIEMAIRAALEVYEHWERVYAPFISDCIEYHDRLPSRIQSWYFCLAGHWHLATLLLADLIEIIDGSELGMEPQRQARSSTNSLAVFRETNCRTLSDLAACACPREDASFAKSGDFHFAVNQGALLTEPWTAVLIRAFATAGVILLESETSPTSTTPDVVYQEDAFRRADDCVKALWYLGRKSDMALSAARILGDALKQRRKGAEEKISDMSSFLEAELWEGFDEMSGAFGVECAS